MSDPRWPVQTPREGTPPQIDTPQRPPNPGDTGNTNGENGGDGDRRRRPVLLGPFGARAFFVGRMFGVDIGIDKSWIIIFALVTYSLAESFGIEQEALPAAQQWAAEMRWAAALLTSFLFFASLLLHELGHSVTSNALGLPVKSITLFIFGGMARLSREPDRPRDEFLIAVAGPAVSFALFGIFLLLSEILPEQLALTSVLAPLCLRVSLMNLVLIIFNCIPGFPLDGGRIFRSFVCGVTGNYRLATRMATIGGIGFAALLASLGAVIVVTTPEAWINGVWLALIAWFLYRAARSSMSYVDLRDGMRTIPVGAVLDSEYERLSGAMSVAGFARTHPTVPGDSTYVVQTHDILSGFITVGDIKAVELVAREVTPLQAIARPIDSLVHIAPRTTLWDAMQKMEDSGVELLAVSEGKTLFGIVSRRGLFTGFQRLGQSATR